MKTICELATAAICILAICGIFMQATAKPRINIQELQERIDALEMRILILELMHEHGEPIDKTGAIES